MHKCESRAAIDPAGRCHYLSDELCSAVCLSKAVYLFITHGCGRPISTLAVRLAIEGSVSFLVALISSICSKSRFGWHRDLWNLPEG
jgi:hypothetical protein